MSRIEPGHGDILGAYFDGRGTNFALFSQNATAVELCLFDQQGVTEIARYLLPEKSGDVWHGYVAGVDSSYTYGYRVHGPYEPHHGHRFNPSKLLLDPYAKDVVGGFVHNDRNYDYVTGEAGEGHDQHLVADHRDNSDLIPKARIHAPQEVTENSGGQIYLPWDSSVVYELHAKGFTRQRPDIPDSLRGTFVGLANARSIEYLKALGITAVELMPVHMFVDEPFLNDLGLTNYWGYNTLNYFVPHPGYRGGRGVQSFRQMVDRFHDAGIEVILDVVYNHTAEGGRLGPTLSYRGIDNASYYQLLPEDRRHYINDTGCGNTLNVRHPRVLQMITDSLRYWVQVMGVDGFRFDLAVILGRETQGFSPEAAFFKVLLQDPVLSRVKLIAEPWDIGPGGYQLGNFPYQFSEWNDRYRDTVRRFWRGDAGQLPELARRLHGSDDVFEHRGRPPRSSINFVTSHDGYTLNDLVTYNERHNEANLEQNRDGHRGNYSFNHGVEGPTQDASISRLRFRQQCNFMATLLMSQGVPMLLAGDELGRSQQGNNNAYCQDNELNWLAWDPGKDEKAPLFLLTQALLSLRKAFPVLQASRYRHQPDDDKDDGVQWYQPDGQLMDQGRWQNPETRSVGYLLTEKSVNAEYLPRFLLVLLNADSVIQDFTLPSGLSDQWQVLVDTEFESPVCRPALPCSPVYRMAEKSLAILAGGDLSHLHV